MTLLDQVKNSLKWKKSNKEVAAKLGISVEKYKQLKRQVNFRFGEIIEHPKSNRVVEFKEDLDGGTAEIKGVSVTEPKSAEEIIALLKIDTAKWKLSSYWNKERHDGWHISALVTAVKQEEKDVLAKVLEDFSPSYTPVKKPFINDKFEYDVCGVLSIQDLHFGKENNETIVEDFKHAITNLVPRAYMAHVLAKVVYVIGGDLLNMDSFSGTTTSGTPVDNSQRCYDAYKDAFDALYWSINYIKQFCLELDVVYVPGNHDRLSSYHIAHALSKCFKDEKTITFHADYSERKVITYGANFFAFEHGDVSKKNTPLVYATEYPELWGSTKYRTCYTGHFHSKKTTEFVTDNEHHGFSIKHLPSLSKTDYWHYHNKYTGAKRQAILECHSKDHGKVSEFIHTA